MQFGVMDLDMVDFSRGRVFGLDQDSESARRFRSKAESPRVAARNRAVVVMQMSSSAE